MSHVLEKSADPTPTMMIDSGCFVALIMASIVWGMSLISPSVMISRIVYFCASWLSMIAHSDIECMSEGRCDMIAVIV